MKRLLILSLIMLCGVTTSFSQEEIIDIPEVEAQFPGGIAEFQRYIATNVVYPTEALEMNEQGKVYIKFIVEKDGSLSDVTVERGVSPALDREALRVIKAMPKWTPAEVDGKPVRAICRVPIAFVLDSGNDTESKKERRKRERMERKAR